MKTRTHERILGFSCFLMVILSPFAGDAVGGQKWRLVWSDEFDSEGLPDSAKWGYETGFVRNNESQYYTKARLENARVENGCLILEGRKESFLPEKGASAEYTSASITTRNKASWKYGRVEARAKLPQGRGVWPAIWMLGASYSNDADWPTCGEIDILEFVGKVPDTIYAAVHYGPNREGHKTEQGKHVSSNLPNEFHVYSMEWTEERIDFFIDGAPYHSFRIDQAGAENQNPFQKPFYLILNLALGGSWGGDIDDSIFPQKFLIDYVRVYERSDSKVEAEPGTPPNP